VLINGTFQNMEHDTENLAIPSIHWLGIHHSDLLNISASCMQPLGKLDIKKAQDLLKHPMVCVQWKQELEYMLQKGVKAEIQALASISLSYLCDEYLSEKINNRRWL